MSIRSFQQPKPLVTSRAQGPGRANRLRCGSQRYKYNDKRR